MKLLYLFLLGISILLLLLDAFSSTGARRDRTNAFTVRLMPLAIAVIAFVWFLQIAHSM